MKLKISLFVFFSTILFLQTSCVNEIKNPSPNQPSTTHQRCTKASQCKTILAWKIEKYKSSGDDFSLACRNEKCSVNRGTTPISQRNASDSHKLRIETKTITSANRNKSKNRNMNRTTTARSRGRLDDLTRRGQTTPPNTNNTPDLRDKVGDTTGIPSTDGEGEGEQPIDNVSTGQCGNFPACNQQGLSWSSCCSKNSNIVMRYWNRP